MAEEKTGIDALRIYHTSAHARGGTQNDAGACLGGKRAGTELKRLGCIVSEAEHIPAIIIEDASGANGEGEGEVRATDTNTLAYIAPSGTQGTAVAIAAGETKLLIDTDTDKAVRVTWDSDFTADIVGGHSVITLVHPFGTALGMDNVTDAEGTAGLNTYRGLMLRNDGATDITLLKVGIKTLGTQRTTDTTQLGAAGAGTIVTTGSFADWPATGWGHIKDSGGSIREIIYYNSRTDTTLTVTANGRARLGTAAGAGAATDTIDAVPGIRLAGETEDANGDIQTIANESTAPAAVSWDSGITAADGVSIDTLASGVNHGLWIHREIPATAAGAAILENAIEITFTFGGTAYTETFSGLYRIAEDALKLYRLWIGEDADPDLTAAPDTTSATLPFASVIAPPGAGEADFNCIVRYQNEYGLESLNRYQHTATVDFNGVEQETDITAPVDIVLADVANGLIEVTATYHADQDPDPADTWVIYFRGDASDPIPGTDTPETETMVAGYMLRPSKTLRREIGPFAQGSTIHVIVRARRASDSAESANTTASTIEVGTMEPATMPYRRLFLGNSNMQHLAPPTISRTVYVSTTDNIRFELTPGLVEFWAGSSGSVHVWSLKYDGLNGGASNNGFWTTFGFHQVASTASTTATVTNGVEMVDVNTLYIPIDGIRRLCIDCSSQTIECAALRVNPDAVVERHEDDPVEALDWHACLQVWDMARWQYQTVASLDTNGILTMLVGWKQVASTGDIL